MSEQQDELRRELNALNAEWDAITAKRRAWMDAHMADFATYPIGTELFARYPERGAFSDSIGRVTGYYRFHADRDRQYDRSMSIDYRTDRGDNSSRYMGMVESGEERAVRLRREADMLAQRTEDAMSAPP